MFYASVLFCVSGGSGVRACACVGVHMCAGRLDEKLGVLLHRCLTLKQRTSSYLALGRKSAAPRDNPISMSHSERMTAFFCSHGQNFLCLLGI